MSDLLGALLPAYVRVVEQRERGDVGTLLPEELALVAEAGPARQREFAAVRVCARQALTALGRPPVPILPGRHGAPTWPDGVRGSLTHCPGYAAAAVTQAPRVLAVGIDAEPAEPLPEGVLDVVATDAERSSGPVDLAAPWDRVLFCAKEAVFKVCSAGAGVWLGPERISVHLDDGGFTATLAEPVRLGEREVGDLTGRWSATAGLVLAAVVVEQRH